MSIRTRLRQLFCPHEERHEAHSWPVDYDTYGWIEIDSICVRCKKKFYTYVENTT